MKNFFLFLAVLGISVSSADAGQPQFGPISITPLGSGIITTNTPVSGQTLFSGGGSIYYWDWATNSPATNIVLTGTVFKNAGSTAAFIANAGIYSTNFSVESVNYISNLTYQVILTAAFANDTIVSNGLITYVGNSTNLAYGYSRTIGVGATNEVARQIGQLVLTNVVVISGANMTVVTNVVGGVTSYTVSTSASGATTNVFIAAGANVTVTTNAVGSSTIYTIAASSGAGVAVAAGADILMTTNAGIVTITFNTSPTNVSSITFVGGGVIQGLSGATGSGSFNRVAAGITNGFMNTYNVIDFGASPALADNSTAIQNALNAASTNGGRVYIPAATNAYTCTSTINIPDGVTLFGDTTPYGGGNGNASQIYNSSSALAVTFGNGSIVKNILFQGGGVNGTQIGIANRYTTAGISGYSFDGCLIKNFAIGMVLSNTWDGYFPNDTISACQRSVVFSNYANSITFLAGHYGSSAYSTSIAFDVRGDDLQQKSNLSFIGCIMEVSSNSFCLRSGGGGWDNINISGYSEGSTNVIYASGGLNLNIDHLSFVQSGGTSTTNIVLRGVKQVAMDHCYFFNSVAFDADSATFGLSFDKNYVESGVTWNNRATTSTIDDNTNIVHTGKSIYGPSANFGSLVLTNLSSAAAVRMLGVDASGNVVTNQSALAYTNEVTRQVTLSTNGGFSLNQIARSNIVDQIQTWPTSTNQLVAIPGSTSWLLQSATPTAQTNISGTLSATQWILQSLVVSNSTAAAFTNRITIPAAKAVGYAATNDVAVLGGNMTVIPASSYKEILFKVRLGQTNWAVINP